MEMSSFLTSLFGVPLIGGQQLNMHLLYVEVTKRGGYKKVVEAMKWSEVSHVFGFPATATATATSASHTIKKIYENLLLKFEEFYFLKLRVPLDTPRVEATLPVNNLPCPPAISVVEKSASDTMQTEQPAQTGEAEFPTVTGWLDGKFEHGYLVSVKIGSEILPGVLYHSSTDSGCGPTVQPSNAVPDEGKPSSSGRKRRRCSRHEP